jgi:hypothetical protein
VQDKLKVAVPKHLEKLPDLKMMSESMPRLIQEIAVRYEEKYHVKFKKDVHLLIGIYGSNAFTYRQIIPDIAFCLEKLSSNELHLECIIAHEFGHALHNMLSDQEGMDWARLDWNSPYTWLLQEGCAIHFSKQAVDAREDEYFAFEDDLEWLDFVQCHWRAIMRSFLEDMNTLPSRDIFREWFSINGGTNYGYTRLAYYIGYKLVENLINEYGEIGAVTFWHKEDYKEILHKKLGEIES